MAALASIEQKIPFYEGGSCFSAWQDFLTHIL
jgi:hypothetical protein